MYRQVSVAPAYGGATCPALYKTIACNSQKCPVDCVVSSWTDVGSLSGSQQLCSVTCGGGIRAQIRQIITFPGYGGLACPSLTRQISCNPDPCPVDCVVSQWAAYDSYSAYNAVFSTFPYLVPSSSFSGVCSRTCGEGTRILYRYITQQPMYGGAVCPALTIVASCNLIPCPDDCVVGDWAPFSSFSLNEITAIAPGFSDSELAQLGSCSQSCGSGQQMMFRKVVSNPIHNGAACPALTTFVSCN